ncbi:MAG: transglycosylase SLT domain-containing protein [Hyphomicrobiales bacterium]
MSIVNAIEPPVHISDAIRKASRKTGTDFNYLLTTAARESAFKQTARAKTSSAAGLFQFIDKTWLQTLKEEGPRFGLGEYASKIFRTESGKYYVPDDKARDRILRLRYDPDVASVMAGAFTRQNADYLKEQIGRTPSQGELYIAHFLGAEGANKLITLAEDAPHQRADRHFPRAAEANRGIFYSHGTPNTVAQVYENLVSDHSRFEATMVAGLPAADEAGQAEAAPAQAAKEDPGLGKRIQLAAANLLDARPDVSGLFRGPIIGPPRINLASLLPEASGPRPALLGQVPQAMEKPAAAPSGHGTAPAPGIAEAVAMEVAENKGTTGSIGVWTTMVLHPDETAPQVPPPSRKEKPAVAAARSDAAPETVAAKAKKREDTAAPVKRTRPSQAIQISHGNALSRADRFSRTDFWQSVGRDSS